MGIRLSHSAASRYRQCPQKYFLAKKWQTNKKGSALVFGTAIEEGITQILVTDSLDEGISKFYIWWENENGDKKKPIFDNPAVEYFKSDYDKDLVKSDSTFVEESYKELLGDYKEWSTWGEAWETAMEYRDHEGPEFPEFYDDLMKFMNRVYWWSCRLKGRYMIKAFYEQIYHEIEEVVEIGGKTGNQLKIELKNEDGDSIVGYLDYGLKFKGRDNPTITDCKTAAQPYDDHKIDTSEQLRTYVSYINGRYGTNFDAAYLVLLKKLTKSKFCPKCKTEYDNRKRKCDGSKCNGAKLETTFKGDCQLLFTEYSEELLEDVLIDYENIAEAIDNEIVFRNTDSCFNFGRKCEFYEVCWKSKKPEEVDQLVPKKENKKRSKAK